MKVLESLEKRIKCHVSIDDMQFGFMPRKGTNNTIFKFHHATSSGKELIKEAVGYSDVSVTSPNSDNFAPLELQDSLT